MKTVKVSIEFNEEVLGTASANPELYRDFIASKREGGPAPDEAAALPTIDDELQKSMTVFSRTPKGEPCLWDYQLKGFFKDACGALSRASTSKSSKLRAYKKVIDGLIFVTPRQIPLLIPDGGVMGTCERPLRAQTAQGERVALAKSETVPAGTKIVFEVQLLEDSHLRLLEEWLDYGALRGIGQWRNSGKGRFTATMK